MNIQKHDMFALKFNDFSLIDIRPIMKSINNIYYIRMFLLYSFGFIRRSPVLNFIENLKTIYQNGISFEEVNINIDNQNNIVYFSESYHTYDRKPITAGIEELLEQQNFIALCKIGFLDYITMRKENFINLLLVWNKILNEPSPFALLYQDENNWYDILPFDTQEAMEQFIADHTKQETIQS